MKKSFLLSFFAVATLASCQNDADVVATIGQKIEATFHATISTNTTRTSAEVDNDGKVSVLWSEDDAIAMFAKGSTENSPLTLDGGEGTTTGTFVGEITEGASGSYIAYYPYNEAIALNGTSLSVTFPDEQTYTEGSLASAPMLAVSDDKSLSFENLAALVCVTLTGDETIESVSLSGNNDEILAGAATVDVSTGALALDSSADKTAITLDCGDGIALNNEGVAFYFVVPAMEFENGFTVVATTTDGEIMSKGSASDVTLEASKVYNYPPIEFEASAFVINTPEALKAALNNGGEYILASDIELNLTPGALLTIDEGKSVTIDLNGKTLTTSNTTPDSKDDITIKGTLVVKNGSVKTVRTAFFANGGNLTLTDCEATSSNTTGATVVSVTNGGTLNINGGSYSDNPADTHDRYAIGVKGGSTANINTIVSGGNGGVTVIGASTADLTGGSYSGVKACGLYVDGGSTVIYSDDCVFSGVEGDVVVGNQNGGGKVNGTTYNEYTKFKQVSTPDEVKSILTNGGNVILASDIELNLTSGDLLTIDEGKSVTIDLNGKTLTTSNTTPDSKDDITIQGTLVVKNGYVNTVRTAFFANGGNLTLTDCVATSSNTTGATVVSVTNGGTLNINGGSYYDNPADTHDRYAIGVKGGSTANINTIVSGGNGGVTVIGASTAHLTGGSYSGVKACGLYIDGGSTVIYSDDCVFSGVEGDVVVGNQNGGGTVNGTTYNAYTKLQ